MWTASSPRRAAGSPGQIRAPQSGQTSFMKGGLSIMAPAGCAGTDPLRYQTLV
jgi:hypothetical protein